ncbi:hypothetical protein B0H16DRAFT_1465437 [Mycena metata]|uniref:Uncharacterized protein n=1 Tax=Mycena metata TaxID=1033252 RepID=A0AAD7IB71_9AGAR|nr:hypothetical protein B0H16DRAFT_1465437 [Mycena metata]
MSLQCYNHHQDDKPWIYHFPKGVQPGSLVPHSIVDSRATPSVSAPLKAVVQCSNSSCVNTRVSRLCANGMCKSHCDLRGGCPITYTYLRLPLCFSLTSIEKTRREAAQRDAEEKLFMDALSSPVLSQEEQDYQTAVLNSLSSPSSPAASTPISPRQLRKTSLTVVEWLQDGEPAVVKWQKHLRIDDHPDLWDLLKKWIRMTDPAEFNATWIKIQRIGPPEFVKYLTTTWMSEHVVKMWSAVYQRDRTIFQACDTNMLIEAYVSATTITLNPVVIV